MRYSGAFWLSACLEEGIDRKVQPRRGLWEKLASRLSGVSPGMWVGNKKGYVEMLTS